MPSLNLDYIIGPAGAPRRAAFIQANFEKIRDYINAGLDQDRLATAVASRLGLSQTGTVRSGVSVVATEETRASTSYGSMSSPDRVQSVVLPTSGLLRIAFQATWLNSAAGAGRCGVFLNGTQLGRAGAGTVSGVETSGSPNGSNYVPLASYAAGLNSDNGSTNAYTGDVTTGQLIGAFPGPNTIPIGGPMFVFAAAGTYDVSIRWAATSGFVQAKNRKLWVEAVGF